MVVRLKKIEKRITEIIETLNGDKKLTRGEIRKRCESVLLDCHTLTDDVLHNEKILSHQKDLVGMYMEYTKSVTEGLRSDFLNETLMSRKAARLEEENAELKIRIADFEGSISIENEKANEND